MSEQDKQEAAEHAARAARQAKHASKNAGRAAAEGAEYVAEEGKRRLKRIQSPGSGGHFERHWASVFSLCRYRLRGVLAFDSFNSAYQGGDTGVKR